MQQLFSMTQQEASRMQCMLDISRSMSKAYADLVSNFNSTLTNLVLVRRDAYLQHAHPKLDTFRLRSLWSSLISGGDLFDRPMMKKYEQHLIGLAVKTGTKKEHFHPCKKKKGRGGHQRQHAQQGVFYQPMYSSTWCNSPFFPTLKVAEEVEVVA